jgi:hypothetical protein
MLLNKRGFRPASTIASGNPHQNRQQRSNAVQSLHALRVTTH